MIPKNFTFYHKNDIDISSTSKRGVAFLIHNSLEHSIIDITSRIRAISTKIKSNITFTVINAYISPKDTITEHELHQLISNFNEAVLLLGDFNAWSPLWGSPSFNKAGRIVTNFIQNNNLLLLNDKSPTHFSTRQTLTHLDLSICHPPLNIASTWEVADELHGSDHFPITVKLFNTSSSRPNTNKFFRYKLDSADWEK